ncbi:hypothetical protein H696_00109 [Fonticula alba]|uniref:Peptidase S54 rhomboid domain-containing protein n=1 Tax=Fonticula alba TaxID=691883 RepID=A0A058ZDP4_FONAL|nr:hypothetical protein H696_00109 [Fonticula alba]KCV72515.1 hypothetical protein H696_00109 [Fonticula alba]|eukprot:XP_009492216.1 hypothetical protein H696_00109 [Fonticula alba]
MVGPSNTLLIRLGAKFEPCMRGPSLQARAAYDLLGDGSDPFEALDTVVACPPTYNGRTVNGSGILCTYGDAMSSTCGMGGFNVLGLGPVRTNGLQTLDAQDSASDSWKSAGTSALPPAPASLLLGNAIVNAPATTPQNSHPSMSGVPDQWWRLITPIFIHSGIVHLVGVSTIHMYMGYRLEQDMGALRVGLIYFVSGIFGNTVSANLSPFRITAGSNAALYGLSAVVLMDLIQNWRLLVYPWFAAFLMVFCMALAFLLGMFVPHFDNISHIGGFVAGALAGLVLSPRITFNRRDKIIKITMAWVAGIVLAGLLAVSIWFFFQDGTEWSGCLWCHHLTCIPLSYAWCHPIMAPIST